MCVAADADDPSLQVARRSLRTRAIGVALKATLSIQSPVAALGRPRLTRGSNTARILVQRFRFVKLSLGDHWGGLDEQPWFTRFEASSSVLAWLR